MKLSEPLAGIWFGVDESPPGPGMVLVLNYHHEGESHWCSPKQARYRIECILNGFKPEDEWGWRMENMKVVLYGEWWNSKAVLESLKVYNKTCHESWVVYDKTYKTYSDSKALAVYYKARLEADAVRTKVCSGLWGEEYPAEAWVAENVPIPKEEP